MIPDTPCDAIVGGSSCALKQGHAGDHAYLTYVQQKGAPPIAERCSDKIAVEENGARGLVQCVGVQGHGCDHTNGKHQWFWTSMTREQLAELQSVPGLKAMIETHTKVRQETTVDLIDRLRKERDAARETADRERAIYERRIRELKEQISFHEKAAKITEMCGPPLTAPLTALPGGYTESPSTQILRDADKLRIQAQVTKVRGARIVARAAGDGRLERLRRWTEDHFIAGNRTAEFMRGYRDACAHVREKITDLAAPQEPAKAAEPQEPSRPRNHESAEMPHDHNLRNVCAIRRKSDGYWWECSAEHGAGWNDKRIRQAWTMREAFNELHWRKLVDVAEVVELGPIQQTFGIPPQPPSPDQIAAARDEARITKDELQSMDAKTWEERIRREFFTLTANQDALITQARESWEFFAQGRATMLRLANHYSAGLEKLRDGFAQGTMTSRIAEQVLEGPAGLATPPAKVEPAPVTDPKGLLRLRKDCVDQTRIGALHEAACSAYECVVAWIDRLLADTEGEPAAPPAELVPLVEDGAK